MTTPMNISAHSMPVLIINMGGEMLYILEQRLQAQSIVEEKSSRVLQDVISTMFSEKFIGELFKPQRIYSNSSTRQIFDRLAHSSIMRLNESSMDKLYDLMTMGCKYQILSCGHPSDLLQISLNHLDALRKLVKQADVTKLVESCSKTFLDMFKDLKPADYAMLRHTLCRFFQDRRVKVSLFLQDAIQAADGSIVITHKGVLPRGSETPGTIRYFDEGKMIKEEKVKLPNSENVSPASDVVDITKPNRPCQLGTNLYAKDRRKGKAKVTAKPEILHKSQAFEPNETAKKAAKAELNMLASMLGGSATAADKLSIVNLFPDTSLNGNASDSSSAGGNKTAEVITFDQEDAEVWSKQLAQQIGNMGLDSKEDKDDDDLLSLMDKTGKS
jgi:hypothetical protein